ncbi:MAG: hypothetical protein AAGK78_01890 [Planctomycetota bacterium]
MSGDALMSRDAGWTWRWYIGFRVLLGVYLASHLGMLLPWAAELFSSGGVLPAASASPLFKVMPSLFWISDTPAMATGVVAAGAVLGVVLAAGRFDRVAALLLWWIWAMLLCRNPLTLNPGLPYVGLLLLVHAATPKPGATERTTWRKPAALHGVVWILLAVGYTYSGLWKLASPSWRDGSAIFHVLHNPLARPWPTREWLLALPGIVLTAMTYAALAAEILFAPLALSRRIRPLLWAAATAGHVTVLILLDFADLTLGVLLVHAYVFEPAWLQGRWFSRSNDSSSLGSEAV